MSKKAIDRRTFLKLSAVTTVSAALAACAGPASPTPQPQPTKVAATTVPPTKPPEAAATTAPTAPPAPKYKEAPMLADLVKAGKLPPVEQRLPQEPRVIQPVEKIGKYGGTWRRAYKGVSDRWGPTKLQEEPMIQWLWSNDKGVQVTANLCTKWEQNADASQFTFYLRKGIKWSDGEEFNTDDVKFWYEDVLLNKTLIPSIPDYMRDPDGTPMKLEVIDKYTFSVKYGKPKPLLPITLAKLTGTNPVGPSFAMPEHYLKKFHEKYGEKATIDKAVADRKFATWDQLWNNSKGDLQGPIAFWFLNPDLPVICAWKMKVPPPAEHMVMERNPYFWKVDPEGNQLPYIDQVTHDLFSDQQVFNMWLVSGKIDCQYRYTDTGAYTLYKENEQKGGYRVLRWLLASTNAVYPNINCPDPVLAKLFDTAEFRHALSIAINRQELADLLYNGLMTPRQASPVHGSPNYDPEFEKKWAEYDPATANKLLDDLGLKKGADGIRLRPDGKPLEITIESQDTPGSQAADEGDRIAKYWTAVGIKTTFKIVERSLYTEHYQNGTIEVGRWGCDRNSIVMADPGRYIGITQDGPWAPLYAAWYAKSPTKQVEPPADHPIRKIWALWDQCQAEADETKRNALFKQLLDIHKEHPYMIGTVGEAAALWIVSNKVRNVPDGRIEDDTTRDEGLATPCQFFFDV